MADASGKRAAAAAIVLITAWVATYWLWEPREGQSAAVVFDDAPPAVALDTITRDEQPAIADPLADVLPKQTEPEPAPTQRLVPPEFTLYTVQRGDDLMVISQRLYGQTRHWQAISKANPNLDPRRLRVGQELLVPKDPGNIQGKVVDAAGETQTPAPPEPETIEHVVQRNDSLWKIAEAFYGSGVKWTIIRDANRDLVGEEGEKLRAGMTLRIPPAPSRAR